MDLKIFQDVELALLTRSLLNIVTVVLLQTRAGEVVGFSLILLQSGGVLPCSSIQQHLDMHILGELGHVDSSMIMMDFDQNFDVPL